MTATSAEVRHGRYTSYTTGGCRCTKCKTAMSRYNKRRTMLMERGEWQPWADAAPVRQHVARLRESGLSLESIAEMAGVAHCNIHALLNAGRPRVRKAFADKLMNVKGGVDGLQPWAKVDATGTRRRLQALAFMGWNASNLAQRVGIDRSHIHKLMSRSHVRVSTARAVRAVFEELAIQSPPADTRYERMAVTRTRRDAEARGWVSAMAWDDIDDPQEQPKGSRGEAP